MPLNILVPKHVNDIGEYSKIYMKTGENSENKYIDIKVGPDMYGHGQ